MKKITPSQLQVFLTVLKYFGRFSAVPGMRDLANELGYASHGTVQQHVNSLIDQGYLARENGLLCVPINPVTFEHVSKALSELGQSLDRAQQSA